MDKQQVFSHVDHTLLKAVSTWSQVEALCREAVDHGMATVCIPPSFVKRACEAFPALKVCTVIGFPLGYSTMAVKLYEAQQALQEGAAEIDMVVNLGDVKAGNFDAVTEEIAALKAAAGRKVLKVIVETCYLTEQEKVALCHCVTKGGADYIKTSTGFGTGGATLDDVKLFANHIGPKVKIKASGGIRTREDLEAFLAAGADRLGASGALQAYAEKG
jgi:deoxyribose-phosphate aldolase